MMTIALFVLEILQELDKLAGCYHSIRIHNNEEYWNTDAIMMSLSPLSTSNTV